ncbi:MAG: hypothetical protein WC763_01690 [Candidatus Paceibacterota bacterium]|jgi:hypothetical protein
MSANSQNPFGAVFPLKAPESLRGSVLARVAREQKRSFAMRMAISLSVEIVSVAAVAGSLSYIAQSLTASGMYGYLGLIFSDGTGLLGYSKELVLSLVEATPVLAVAGIMAAALFFGWSTLRLVRQSRSVSLYA